MQKEKSQNTFPSILVIFGATGDLMRNKLIPALFRLYENDLLPSYFQIIGFSRRDLTDEAFQKMVADIATERGFSGEIVEKFSKYFAYAKGSFEEKNGYNELAGMLGMKDKEWKTCANKLFYLAVPPKYYRGILTQLSDSGMTEPCSPEEGWTRVAVEKPFGNNQQTAEDLEKLLGKLFQEEQIYRIDHYLGKETVQNIFTFRFSNSFLESAWDKNSIERIEIKLFEKDGIRERGEFYDALGALRDVGQNHLLQLLALFTMKNPKNFDAEALRKNRAAVLESLEKTSGKYATEHTIRGQYSGYTRENGVPSNSKTETYFRIETELDMPEWRGVPIILEGGKNLGEERVEVLITFKHPTPCLCPSNGKHYENILTYRIQPHEKISISFWVKKPGLGLVPEEKDFSFDYHGAYEGTKVQDAYERLLLDVIEGNQTLFVSTAEIIASWKFIDPITDAWQDNQTPLLPYKPQNADITREPLPPSGVAKKEVLYIGLGKMGRNMVLHMQEKGWRVRAYDLSPEARKQAEEDGITVIPKIEDLLKSAPAPRLVWLMVPAGKPVDELLFGTKTFAGLAYLLRRGDVVIDGGNSFFEDTVRRAKKLQKRGILFLDAGISGGPDGARNGACIMVGGDKKLYKKFEPLFHDLSLPGSYAHMGGVGSGHFVKMIHNGIEYGMMQSLAEGFAVLKKSPFSLDLERIAELYNNGSVIESRLVKWLWEAYNNNGPGLEGISGTVGHTGEGEWTIKAAKKLKVKTPVIEDSFKFRVRSKKKPDYAGQVLSALRHQFGGHDAGKK